MKQQTAFGYKQVSDRKRYNSVFSRRTQRYKKTFSKSEMVTKLNKKIIRNRTSSLPGLHRNRWGRAVDSSPAFFASVNILGLQMTWILYEFHRLKNAYSCIWFFASYPLKMVCTVLPQSDHVHDALESNFRKSRNSWLEEIVVGDQIAVCGRISVCSRAH